MGFPLLVEMEVNGAQMEGRAKRCVEKDFFLPIKIVSVVKALPIYTLLHLSVVAIPI
jgi:hypothetical protein